MDDTYNERLRQEVEEWLRKAMDQIKLVKDEQFCNSVAKILKQMKDLMLKNNRLRTSTLEEYKKLIQTALRKTFSKLVLENYTDDGFFESTALQNFLYSDSTGRMTSSNNSAPRTDPLNEDNNQRLALKYPRKKIDSPNQASNTSHIAEQSTSTLFKRRHEVFAAPRQPATYSEYRRMMQERQDIRKYNTPKVATDTQVTVNNNDKSSDTLKQCDLRTVQSVSVEFTSPNNPSTVAKSNQIVGDKSQTSKAKNMDALPETANKSNRQYNVNDCPTNDSKTNNDTNDQAIENGEKSKSVKPNHKNKINHRELHDLLSYTTEIFPKLSRRKSVAVEEDQNTQLLKQFGITQTVQIVLQRLPDFAGQIAHRTRSKSIDSTKYLEQLETVKPAPVPVQNKISQRSESKSMEHKKPVTTSTTTNAKMKKETARKSVSKSRNNVKATTSSKNSSTVKKCLNNNTIEKTQKPIKENTASKRKIQRSQSPPPVKRTRSNAKDSTDIRAVKNDLQNLSEDSDEDEPIIPVPNVVLNPNPQSNNDPKVHCHSDYMEKCCLCSYSGELMVRHYVYNHSKKAVYISRLAPEQSRLIKADPFGISGRKAVSRYGDQEIIVFRCHFCDLRLSEPQELWLDHISKHTGEYRYKCMLCPTFARLPIDRVVHHSFCTNPSMQLWHNYTFEENHLYAYMCNKCNFVQVLLINMKRHLREDHPEASSLEIGYTKFSLVNFNLQDEDMELPFGKVKLEPILDDTNTPTQINIKQEVDPLEEDSQTHITAPQAIVQEQGWLQPETILVKQEVLADDINQCKTNTANSIPENGPESREKSQCTFYSNIRVKKLPGDILSTVENKRRVCLENNQETAASSMVALKPWNGTDAGKRMLHKNKLTVPFLAAPYKCTVFNCGFHTNALQTIGSHFQSHLKQNAKIRDKSWLECCYCNYTSLSVQMLLKHIETVHKYSAYQCDRCCYRSRDPNSVRVHQRNYHNEHDADAKILCIPSRQKDYSSVDSDIIMNELKSNVKLLQCRNCSSRKFNDLEQYRNHIKSHDATYIACHFCGQLMSAKKMISHISSHNICMIQCIYCDYGINDLQTIKKHVADEHSEKLLCYHVRFSKPNVPPFIRVQDIISPERFINCESN